MCLFIDVRKLGCNFPCPFDSHEIFTVLCPTEVLPLVEFFLEEGMLDEEAVHILDMSVPKRKKERSWKESRMSSILDLRSVWC